MPKLVAEVKASHFHRTGSGGDFIIHKMKSGERRGDSVSFRSSSRNDGEKGLFGFQGNDFLKIIACFIALYGFQICLFIGFLAWNSACRRFEALYLFMTAGIITWLGIVYVSIMQYQRSMQMKAAQSTTKDVEA